MSKLSTSFVNLKWSFLIRGTSLVNEAICVLRQFPTRFIHPRRFFTSSTLPDLPSQDIQILHKTSLRLSVVKVPYLPSPRNPQDVRVCCNTEAEERLVMPRMFLVNTQPEAFNDMISRVTSCCSIKVTAASPQAWAAMHCHLYLIVHIYYSQYYLLSCFAHLKLRVFGGHRMYQC